MTRKAGAWLAVLVLTLGVVPAASAFPPFPPFQCPWHEAKDCPCPSYSCCHYLVPSFYTCRAYHTPPRYVYGCQTDMTFVGYRIDRYPCKSASSAAQSAIYTESGRGSGSPDNAAAEQPPPGPESAPSLPKLPAPKPPAF